MIYDKNVFTLSQINSKDMNAIKKPLSVKVIYYTTNILFWIFAFAAGLAAILSIAMFWGFMKEMQLHVGVPIAVDVVEKGSISLYKQMVDVQFVEMYGKVHFIDTPVFVSRIYSVYMMAVVGLMFFIFFTFRKFINNVYRGEYFDISNIALLKRIAYAILGLWVFSVFYAYFQYYVLMINLEFESITLNGEMQFYPLLLLAALFLWVLSHILMKGSELQEEQTYTI